MSADQKPEVWAIVELMGHVRVAGRISEEEKFGAKLGRLDVPMPDSAEFVTQFFGGGSVYRITIVSEEAARIAASRSVPQPVHPWELPKAIAGHTTYTADPPTSDDQPEGDIDF